MLGVLIATQGLLPLGLFSGHVHSFTHYTKFSLICILNLVLCAGDLYVLM